MFLLARYLCMPAKLVKRKVSLWAAFRTTRSVHITSHETMLRYNREGDACMVSVLVVMKVSLVCKSDPLIGP